MLKHFHSIFCGFWWIRVICHRLRGHRVKYGLDHFLDHFLDYFLDHFLDHLIEGKHTISTHGGVGCSLLVLREGWEAECYYSGRGERRTIARQWGVRGGCKSKHYLLMELLLDRTNYLHRFFDWLFECSSFLSSCESETATWTLDFDFYWKYRV